MPRLLITLLLCLLVASAWSGESGGSSAESTPSQPPEELCNNPDHCCTCCECDDDEDEECSTDEQSAPTCSSGYSSLNDLNGRYRHWAWDYRPQPAGASGCAPCGTTGPSGVGQLPGLSVKRYFTADCAYPTSFGMFWGWQGDLWLLCYPPAAGGGWLVEHSYPTSNAIDATAFHDPDGDQVFTNRDRIFSRGIRFYLADGVTTTGNPALATTAVLTRRRGGTVRFELFTEGTGSNQTVYGRVLSVADRQGNVMAWTYKRQVSDPTLTTRSLLRQIDRVTDAYGRSMAFTYAPAQINGRWVVTRIDLPDGQRIDYVYGPQFWWWNPMGAGRDPATRAWKPNATMLSEVRLPGGQVARMSTRYDDNASGCIAMSFAEPMEAKPAARLKTILATTSPWVDANPATLRYQVRYKVGTVTYQATFPAPAAQFGMQVKDDLWAKPWCQAWANDPVRMTAPEVVWLNGVVGPPTTNPITLTLLWNTATQMFGRVRAIRNGEDQAAYARHMRPVAAPPAGAPAGTTVISFRWLRTGEVTAYAHNGGADTLARWIRHLPTADQHAFLALATGPLDFTTGWQRTHLPVYPATFRNATTMTDSDGRVTQIERDPVSDAKTRADYPDGTYETWTYDVDLNVTEHRARDGRVTRQTFDAVTGTLASRTVGFGTPEAATWAYSYNARGQRTQERDPLYDPAFPDLHVTDYVYDAIGQLVQVIGAADVHGGLRPVTAFGYDAASGDLIAVTNPRQQTTQFAYDALHRLETTTYADGSTERQWHAASGPAVGLVTRRKDRNHNVTLLDYDAGGRLTLETVGPGDAQGNQTAELGRRSWTWLPGTRLQASATDNGDTTLFGYDLRGRRSSVTRQADAATALTETTAYDDQDRVRIVTDPYGRRTLHCYDINDRVDRVIRERIPGGVPPAAQDEAAWRALPRIGGANPPYVIEETTYDAVGRMLTRTDGRVPAAVTAYTYDGQGRLHTQTEAVGVTPATTTYLYDRVGNRRFVHSPRGVTTEMRYTGRNLLERVIEAVDTPVQTTVRILTYSLTGKVLTETDALGRVTGYAYGGCCDRLTTVTDAAEYQTHFDYDNHGNRTTVTDAIGTVTTTAYDARHRVTAVTRTLDAVDGVQTTGMVYDENLTDGQGLDAALAAVLPQLGLGAGADGSAVRLRDALGHDTYEVRDGLGRTVAQVDALGHATRLDHDTVVGGLVETARTDALGRTTRARSDGLGRTVVQVDALGQAVQAGFDAAGNQLSQIDAVGVGWTATYSLRNVILTRTDSRGANAGTEGWGYDLDLNLTSHTDARLRTEDYTYDQRNRRITLRDRLTPRGTTTFAYDAVGNLVAISDADNAQRPGEPDWGMTRYRYDARNLLIAEAFPAGQAGGRTLRLYGYDAIRRLTSRQVGLLAGGSTAVFPGITDPDPAIVSVATVTAYGYDRANRLRTRSYTVGDGGTDTFTYDLDNRLLTAVSSRSGTTVTRDYDAANRLLSEALTLDRGTLTPAGAVVPATWTVGYAYDDAHQLTSLTYPSAGTVTRTYTVRGELDVVRLDGAPVADRGYDAGGRLTSTVWGANIRTETRTYATGDHQVATIAVPGVTGFGYTYDVNRRKLSETSSVLPADSQTFGYDDANRLTTWSQGAASQSWSLSRVGDWLSTTRDGITETRQHSAVHEATVLTRPDLGSPTLTYDVPGNLTRDERVVSYAWDAENRLRGAIIPIDASVTGFGATAGYGYDALGRRVSVTVDGIETISLHAGAQVVETIRRAALPVPSQAVGGAEADGTLANQALTPSGGGILDGAITARVNWQPQTTAMPAGYLADTGKILGVRTNGRSYGWSTNATAQAVTRHGAVPLVALDTHIQIAPGQTWTISLPNGRYPVAIVAGDPLSTQQTNNLTINGQALPIDTDPASNPGYAAGDFDGWAVMVDVTAGALTIGAGTGALDPKLCLIEIGAAVPDGTTMPQTTIDRLNALITRATNQTGANPEPVAARKAFVYGDYVDEVLAYQVTQGVVTERYYPHYNHLYSVAALTDSTGVVVERFQYDAYGKQKITDGSGNVTRAKSSVGWDRGFTGYITDNESGLLYARNRMYSPSLGRFVSRDPALYKDGPSLYAAYFAPNLLDPYGLACCEGRDNKPYVYEGNDGECPSDEKKVPEGCCPKSPPPTPPPGKKCYCDGKAYDENTEPSGVETCVSHFWIGPVPGFYHGYIKIGDSAFGWGPIPGNDSMGAVRDDTKDIPVSFCHPAKRVSGCGTLQGTKTPCCAATPAEIQACVRRVGASYGKGAPFSVTGNSCGNWAKEVLKQCCLEPVFNASKSNNWFWGVWYPGSFDPTPAK